MSVCNSLSELQAVLVNALVDATDEVASAIEAEIEDAIGDYYFSYDPVTYKRTGILGTAPMKSKATGYGNCVEAQVYMDTERGYSTGTWDLENVISSADNLLHGGWNIGKGISVWREPMEELDKQARTVWKRALINAGIPVK